MTKISYIWICNLCRMTSNYSNNYLTEISPDTGEMICRRCDNTMISVPVVDQGNYGKYYKNKK